jgi:hypothetical protein
MTRSAVNQLWAVVLETNNLYIDHSETHVWSYPSPHHIQHVWMLALIFTTLER